MDDPEVFRGALTASGLDADTVLAQIQDPAVKAKLIANTELSVERGAFGPQRSSSVTRSTLARTD